MPSGGSRPLHQQQTFGDIGDPFGHRAYPVDSDDELYFRRRLVEALRETSKGIRSLDLGREPKVFRSFPH